MDENQENELLSRVPSSEKHTVILNEWIPELYEDLQDPDLIWLVFEGLDERIIVPFDTKPHIKFRMIEVIKQMFVSLQELHNEGD